MSSSLLRNLVTALILYEKIETTEARAKQVKPFAERLLAVSASNTLQARRELQRHLCHPNAVKKVFEVITPNLNSSKRKSGFFHMYRLGQRTGDGAEKVRLMINPQLTEPVQSKAEKIPVKKVPKSNHSKQTRK